MAKGQAIREHLRRLWVIYLAGAVILVFLNHLVYTMTRPGYTDDETLKIMLLNVEIELDEAALLEQVKPLGFETVEIVPLSIAWEDTTSDMLFKVQIISGFGDIYICDAQGLAALEEREVCHTFCQTADGVYLAVMNNGTDVESALAALDVLKNEWGELKL